MPQGLVRLMRSVDLQMMVGLNSKERSEEQWVDLLARADSRFKLVKVAMVPALHSLIEVRFD